MCCVRANSLIRAFYVVLVVSQASRWALGDRPAYDDQFSAARFPGFLTGPHPET